MAAILSGGDELSLLTHWGRATHICVGKLTIIGSDNGLSPGRRQAIIWTNAGIFLIGPLGTNFSEILIRIQTFSFRKMHLKISSAKWRPFCLGLNELIQRAKGFCRNVEFWANISFTIVHFLLWKFLKLQSSFLFPPPQFYFLSGGFLNHQPVSSFNTSHFPLPTEGFYQLVWLVFVNCLTRLVLKPGADSISHKTSYHKISQSLKGARSVVKVFQLLSNLVGVYAVLLLMYMPNFKVIWVS